VEAATLRAHAAAQCTEAGRLTACIPLPCYIPLPYCTPHPATPPYQVAHLAAYATSVAAAIGSLLLLAPPAAPPLPPASARVRFGGGAGANQGLSDAAADEGDHAAVQGGTAVDDGSAYLKVLTMAIFTMSVPYLYHARGRALHCFGVPCTLVS